MATRRISVAPTSVAQMKVAQISKPGAGFQIVEREIQDPRVPGHEVAGIIDEVGDGVSAWKKGQRVGVGWHGGHDNTCRECRRGDFRNCKNGQIPGISYDGGEQRYMVAP